jgi:hypothetical protein
MTGAAFLWQPLQNSYTHLLFTALTYQANVLGFCREPIAIGWHARKLWLGMDSGARSIHTYVESFKLALQDAGRAASMPSWLSAEQVVMAVL